MGGVWLEGSQGLSLSRWIGDLPAHNFSGSDSSAATFSNLVSFLVGGNFGACQRFSVDLSRLS